MTAELHSYRCAIDLSARTKLRITGADRLRYLNGQITNDARKANANLAIRACVLNAKGRINADLFLHIDGDSFLLDAEEGMRETLALRLERYVIADDVQIEDVTEQFSVLHVLGPDVPQVSSNHSLVAANRFDLPGTDIWLRREDFAKALEEVAGALPLCDSDAAETLRIERGVPRWGQELTEDIIPTEANLESSAIDYAKGCYIGQEVISRMKMSGQTNKRLCGLALRDGSRLEPQMRLTSADRKDVGWLTSVTDSARVGSPVALAFVKRGSQAVGTQLKATGAGGENGATVEVVALPFL